MLAGARASHTPYQSRNISSDVVASMYWVLLLHTDPVGAGVLERCSVTVSVAEALVRTWIAHVNGVWYRIRAQRPCPLPCTGICLDVLADAVDARPGPGLAV